MGLEIFVIKVGLSRLESEDIAVVRELKHRLAPSTVLHILKDHLKMRKFASKWVPHDLTDMEKWQRYVVSRTLLERYVHEGEVFLQCIITIDETWARSYEMNLS
ncbi:hypothetical protein ANN_22706 [Periplaneta americana]|uniref:Histone-lysine N-methyltransferase SETMAR n=1 Tax=Periplaneta americana TaxID=6978 RepID=A0ABQ8S9I6_PERAM|nr:hypothetical protein ANN_22706 [Periplaneta americana]